MIDKFSNSSRLHDSGHVLSCHPSGEVTCFGNLWHGEVSMPMVSVDGDISMPT